MHLVIFADQFCNLVEAYRYLNCYQDIPTRQDFSNLTDRSLSGYFVDLQESATIEICVNNCSSRGVCERMANMKL